MYMSTHTKQLSYGFPNKGISCCLQLVVEISSVSPISLGYCANSSFISQLLGELTGDDILIR